MASTEEVRSIVDGPNTNEGLTASCLRSAWFRMNNPLPGGTEVLVLMTGANTPRWKRVTAGRLQRPPKRSQKRDPQYGSYTFHGEATIDGQQYKVKVEGYSNRTGQPVTGSIALRKVEALSARSALGAR